MMSTQTTTTLPSTLHTTATSSANASDIIVEMGYVKENPDGTAPSFSQLHEWHPDSLDLRNVVIRDVRDKQDGVPELDKNGFEYFDMEFNEDIDYADDEDVKAKWYPRIEEVLKERYVLTFYLIIVKPSHEEHQPFLLIAYASSTTTLRKHFIPSYCHQTSCVLPSTLECSHH